MEGTRKNKNNNKNNNTTLEMNSLVDFPYFFASLEKAKKDAEQLGKFLLINVHNPFHELTEPFLESKDCVLRGPSTTSGGREDDGASSASSSGELWSQILMGSVHFQSVDGATLVSRLELVSYPAAVLLWGNHVVSVLQGPNLLKRQEVEIALRKAVDGGWGTVAAADIAKSVERQRSRDRERAQEEAEREAERIDRERLAAFDRQRAEEARAAQAAKEEAERTRRLAEEAASREREEAERRQREEEEAAAALTLQRSLALSRLPDVPKEDELSLSVSFRLPKRQLERRFRPTDSIATLYDFIESSDDYCGKNFALLESGVPPKAVTRCDVRTLEETFGKQKRVLLLFREI